MGPGGKGVPRAEVDLAPLREAFARSGRSITDVARATGIHPGTVRMLLTDAHKVQRKRTTSGEVREYTYRYLSCSYSRALELAEGMGVDPVEVEL